MRSKIETFRGDYHFLSNFYEHESIEFNGLMFNSVESAFQSQKSENPIEQHRFQFMSPDEAKKAGKGVKPLRPDWDKIRLQVMEDCLRLKFAIPKLREKLLETGQAKLIEGNWWRDFWWGVCEGRGENHLGKLLMKVRSELQKENENAV